MSIRHEYVDSLRPLHPIHLRLDTEYVVTKTTVRRTAAGRGSCADDPVVIQHHVYNPFDPRLKDPEVEIRSREIGCEWDWWSPAPMLLSTVVGNANAPGLVAKHGEPVVSGSIAEGLMRWVYPSGLEGEARLFRGR